MADRFNAMIERGLDENPNDIDREVYAYATALFFYNAAAGYKNITKSLKYNGNISAGKYFSGILGDRISESGIFKDIDMIIPVPLHFFRRRTRGYNQAEIIAKVLSERLHAELVTDVIRRNRHTVSQTKLSVEAKYDNVKSAFSVDSVRLGLRIKKYKEKEGRAHKMSDRGIHILLVDDVFTTGATLNACRYALRMALSELSSSALSVYGFPLAACRISIATLAFVG